MDSDYYRGTNKQLVCPIIEIWVDRTNNTNYNNDNVNINNSNIIKIYIILTISI